MGRRGPPKKPTALKLLTGSRKINGDEPKPLNTPPPCPSFLPKEAKAKWKQLQPELSRLGLLTINDGETFACLCSAWADFEVATKTIGKEGRYQLVGGWPVEVPGENGVARTEIRGGQWQPHPAVSQQRNAAKAIKDFGALFGLSPSARVSLHVKPPAGEVKQTTVGARKRG